VVVDCGAIPSELLESELFGHEKGAFTGAASAREGAFELASGGTLFLDEIGELPLELQPKLLRALDRGEVKPVGGGRYTKVDVRVVAATNRDLRAEVNARRFRPDLYYRLAVLTVRLPPLRERMEDLGALSDSILAALAPRYPEAAKELAGPKLAAELARHCWPGNVRELRNYLERCLAMRRPVTIDPDAAEVGAPDAAVVRLADPSLPLKLARERWSRAFERRYLEECLRRNGGNVAAAARAAEVDRMHFYRLLWRHGLR
jgi:transcriptional regulator with GAF, ATPase, and Fis domain